MGIDIDQTVGEISDRDDLLCPICMDILLNPIMLRACKHHYCSKCINQVVLGQRRYSIMAVINYNIMEDDDDDDDTPVTSTCPYCRTEFSADADLLPPSRDIAQKLGMIQVRESRCNQVVPYNLHNEHLKTCSDCTLQVLSCFYSGVVFNTNICY